jgi:hypothetical protein
MKLLANGCSFTAGTDSTQEKQKYNIDISWAKFLAESLNMEYANIATPGEGNEYIYMSTIDWVNKNPTNNLFVCILWSGFERFLTWDNGEHKSHSLYSITMRPTSTFAKSYVESKALMENYEYLIYKNLFYIYMTAVFLERYKIKYCFMNAFDGFTHPDNITNKKIRELYITLLENYGDRIPNHLGFINREEMYSPYLREILKIPNAPYGTKTHWGENGQSEYSKLLHKHITHNGILGN